MTEEQITKTLLEFLKNNNWTILSFDFPQSGTGTVLHPNNHNSKNFKSIISDIIAIKEEVCLFFENKNKVMLSDFKKQYNLINNNNYTNDINNLLEDYNINKIYFGIGILETKNAKLKEYSKLVDFVFFVNTNKEVRLIYNNCNLKI